jgi:DNA-binding ferritin-like protein
MWKERLKRILIILGVMILVLLLGKVFADWQKAKQAAGESFSLPIKQIGEKIEDIGEEILGTAIQVLPGRTEREEIKDETKTETVGEEKVVKQLKIQTQEIIEVIKELPAEQVDQIKKQIFKDFCQKVLEE